jgi:hypothetical protein
MITPNYLMTATQSVLPNLALDFTTAILDSRVTFTRSGNTATVTNSSGVIVGINANLPRFDFNPTTLICKGLLIEESRTNALLNSLIDGTSLATQLVTVTAAARTFSFYGTGTVVLSGAHSATVVGTGAYPTRTTLTFTPSAGNLTLTVTGTVQFAQLETGAFATSYIPTEAAAVTRNADVATMTGTNFSDWFNADEGTFETDFTSNGFVANQMLFSSTPGDLTATIQAYWTAATTITADGGVNATMTITGAQNTPSKFVYAYKTDNYAMSINAATPSTDASGTVPSTLSQLNIGHRNGSLIGNQYIRKFMYWPQRLTNAEVQAFSK